MGRRDSGVWTTGLGRERLSGIIIEPSCGLPSSWRHSFYQPGQEAWTEPGCPMKPTCDSSSGQFFLLSAQARQGIVWHCEKEVNLIVLYYSLLLPLLVLIVCPCSYYLLDGGGQPCIITSIIIIIIMVLPNLITTLLYCSPQFPCIPRTLLWPS